jgi:gliding motility-associated protein GldC
MQQSSISIDVLLDKNKFPEQILWKASDSSADMKQRAKAMCLAFWDAADKSALRIDLWTKDMMVDEMGDFFYQMLMTMADTLTRSTRQEALAEEMKTYARDFFKKFQAEMVKQNAV